jgi:glucose/arabinose dehydrogenase
MKIRTILNCMLSSLSSTAVLFATGIGAILLPSSANGAAGDLYVTEYSQSSIVRITPAGTQSVLANGLDHPFALAVDANGNIFVALALVSEIKKISNGVVSTFASVTNAHDLTFGRLGHLFVAKSAAGANGSVIEITSDGTQSTYASGFSNPTNLAFDQSGNLFVCENGFGGGSSSIISKTTPAGVRTIFASGFYNAEDLAFDAAGNLYLAETGTSQIHKITPSGTKTLFTGAVPIPRNLAFDSAGNLFVSTGGSTDFISKVTPAGAVSTFQSNNSAGGMAFEPPHGIPLNISTRMHVQTGENVLIAGFIVTGTGGKKVLIRGIGPSLGAAGVVGALQDPVIELRNSSGAFVNGNDNWRSLQQAEIQATGIAPTDDRESALLLTLAPGSYTAIEKGKNDSTGIGLVEVYDLDAAAPTVLANISTRGFIETGNNVMIGGFIIGANGAEVVVRAIGPSLTQFGISGALSDPVLSLRNAQGTELAANDDWLDTQPAVIQATGLSPSNELESALVTTLPNGSYTAIVSGYHNATGVGLVEVYNLQ